jgi:hypothetical protein
MKENPNFFLTVVFSVVLIILFANVFQIPVLADVATCTTSEGCACSCVGEDCSCETNSDTGSCSCWCYIGTSKTCHPTGGGGGLPDMDPGDDPE